MRTLVNAGMAVLLVLLWGCATTQGEQDPQQSQADEIGMAADGYAEETVQAVEKWRPVHRQLQVATASAMVLTAAGGVITYLNLPTLDGDGLCARGRPILGEYGCDGLNRLHGIGGATTLVLYAGEQTMDLVLPILPDQPEPTTASRILDGVHATGMLAMPLLGFLSSEPQTIGIPEQRREGFSRTTRTVHLSAAVVTVGAYITSLFVD